MCIIAVKPVGVQIPTDDTIRNMWYNNSDGAGFMYMKDGQVHIEKGFMTLKSFNEGLDRVLKEINSFETPMIFHFRIGTHGGNIPENTHPFPITENLAGLRKLSLSVPLAVVHNGIIPIDARKGISDTMEYVLTQLAPMYKMKRDFYKDKYGQKVIYNAIRSKMAFLDSTGNIELIGDFTPADGILYSNSSYLPRYNYAKWDDKFWDSYYDKYYTHKSGSKFDYTRSYPSDEDVAEGKFLQAIRDEEADSAKTIESLPTAGKVDNSEYGFYTEFIPLMWLDDDMGFIVDNGVVRGGDDYMIDDKHNVFYYDFNGDVAYKVLGATAYTHEGKEIAYDDDCVIMTEVAFY